MGTHREIQISPDLLSDQVVHAFRREDANALVLQVGAADPAEPTEIQRFVVHRGLN